MGDSLMSGVIVTPQLRISNPNGDIFRGMKSSDLGYAGFGEAYFSTVHFGSIKGWKRHRSATLNLLVPVGLIRFVIFDDRVDSQAAGQFSQFVIGGENHSRLTICPGLWVAFTGLSPDLNMLLNISSEVHDPNEADNVEIDSILFNWSNNIYE